MKKIFIIFYFLLFIAQFYVSNKIEQQITGFYATLFLIIFTLFLFIVSNIHLKWFLNFKLRVRKISNELKFIKWGKKKENLKNIVYSFTIIIILIIIIFLYDMIIKNIV